MTELTDPPEWQKQILHGMLDLMGKEGRTILLRSRRLGKTALQNAITEALMGDEPEAAPKSEAADNSTTATEHMSCGRSMGWPRALFEQMFGKDAQEFQKMAEKMKVEADKPLFATYEPAFPVLLGIDPASGPDRHSWYQLPPDGALRQIDPSDPNHDPAEADMENLAICLLAASLGCPFAQANHDWKVLQPSIKTHWFRVAQAAFDHVGYLPSIAAARLREIKATADLAQLRHERDALARSNAELEQRLDAAESANKILSKGYVTVRGQSLAQHGESVTFPAAPQANQTASDVKPQPAPKPFPAGALKQSTADRRRIGQ